MKREDQEMKPTDPLTSHNGQQYLWADSGSGSFPNVAGVPPLAEVLGKFLLLRAVIERGAVNSGCYLLAGRASTGVMGFSVSTCSRPPKLSRSVAASVRFPRRILTWTGSHSRLTALITLRPFTPLGNPSPPHAAPPAAAH